MGRIAATVGMVKPLLPSWIQQRYAARHFFSSTGWQNLHLGRFASFEEANAFARQHRVGTHYRLDHREWAQIQNTIKAHDYPVIHWLGRLLTENSVLCDFGGSVGVCYYAYRERVRFPPGLSWRVCELPEPAALGAQIALERQADGLSFTTDHTAMDGCDVLLAAGVLPFVDAPLPALLSDLAHPPQHILINRLPLSGAGAGFVTLQNTGHSITPMRIDSQPSFIASMADMGYEVADSWKCFENSLHVPAHPECTLRHFHGFCFTRRAVVH